MSADRTESHRDAPSPTTPGRPREGDSRQQKQQDQAAQTGSAALDDEATRKSDTPAVPTVPPGPK